MKKFKPNCTDQSVVESLGLICSFQQDKLVHYLTPTLQANSTPNTYSGIYGNDFFPFHTDLAQWRRPPRYLILRCEIGFEKVPTFLLDGFKLVNNANKIILFRALVKPRRPINGSIPLLRLLEKVGDQNLLRWDQTFLRPASSSGKIGFDEFHSSILKQSPSAVQLSNKGDTLILDNWRMLHARSAVSKQFSDRRISRTYLEELH